MADKRKKFTTYLNPEEDVQDAKALEIIESVPCAVAGSFSGRR
ncbi:plasmid partitioning/stability family protein [Ewingella americana]|nr:plasmid partitioning/stability family protein [Ewingella americana]